MLVELLRLLVAMECACRLGGVVYHFEMEATPGGARPHYAAVDR